MSSGRLVLDLELLDLGDLAAEVVQRFGDEAARVGSTLTLNAPAPVLTVADRQRLDQVLTNLVANALKYGDGSPVELQVDCNSGPTVRVKDRGPGIPPEEHDRILFWFSSGGGWRRPSRGWVSDCGLSGRLVLAHQGRVWVESPPGRRRDIRGVIARRGDEYCAEGTVRRSPAGT